MHDAFTVGVPLIAILAGILFARNDMKSLLDEFRGDIRELRNEMNARFTRVEGHLERIDADLRQFYHLTGKLGASMDAIEKRS